MPGAGPRALGRRRCLGLLGAAAAILLLSSAAGSCRRPETPSVDPQAVFARWASLARAAEERGTIVVEGEDGWLFFAGELRHLGAGRFWGDRARTVSRARRAEWADPLPAILDFHERLREAGVELLVVPVPPKAVVYPDKLPATPLPPGEPPPRLDVHHQAFYALLRERGVPVLDLAPVFLSARHDPRGPVYCRQDTHWSGRGVVVAAERIAAHIRSRPWWNGEAGAPLRHEWREQEIAGDLWRALAAPAVPKERLWLRFVGTGPEGALVPVEPDPSSPVILLGDSHTLVFHAGGDLHAEGAGLADQLALELGVAVDLVGVRGSGATAARLNLLRRARRDPDYWTRKRLVVWCFAARELTESDGWRTLPIRPDDP